MTLRPGAQLGPYTIESAIGQGASATVYRANDPRFDRGVAIKVLSPHLATEIEAVERFSTEARALRSVDSDAVVTVYDIAQTPDGLPYMVLSLADRGTLHDRLKPGRAASTDEINALVEFLDRSLTALHGAGLVHRDVKPSNVLLASTSRPGQGIRANDPTAAVVRPDERLMLADLGLVKDTTTGRALTRGAGSHNYAAPEQRAVVSRVSTQSDIYAASSVVAEATLGRLRDTDESWEDLLAAIRQTRPAFAAALATGLADEPADRYSTMQVWAATLLGALGQDSLAHSAAAATTTPRAFSESDAVFGGARSKEQRLLAGLGLSIALLGLVIFALARVPSDSVMASGTIGVDEDPLPVLLPAPAETPTGTPTPVPASTNTPLTFAEIADARTTADGCDPVNGPVPDLKPISSTTSSITVAWTARTKPMSIFVNGRYHDNIVVGAERYVVEDLNGVDLHRIGFTDHDMSPELGSWVCAMTDGATPSPPTEAPVMATNLVADNVSATTADLSWTPASSGGRYLLVYGTLADGKRFPDIKNVGIVKSGAPTTFSFADLIPGASNVIGLRTVLGDNHSNLAWISVDTPEADRVEDERDETEVLGTEATPDQAAGAAGEQAAEQAAEPKCGAEGRGPVPDMQVLGASLDSILVEWTARAEPMSIFVDGRYHDTITSNANRYLVEGLTANTEHDIAIANRGDEPSDGSRACAVTGDGAPIPKSAAPTMATLLRTTRVSDRTVELSWTPATSGGRYLIFHGILAEGERLPDAQAVGAVAAGEATLFEFTDLIPEATNVIGVRTVLGENQSNLAWIAVDIGTIASTGPNSTSPGGDAPDAGPDPVPDPPTDPDGCAGDSAGPVPDLRVLGTTETSIGLEWTTLGVPLSIYVDGRYHDNIKRDANRYVVEGLDARTNHRISFANHDDYFEFGTIVCATTDAATALPAAAAPTMAAALIVTDMTATTAQLTWEPASSGGRYLLAQGTLDPGRSFPTITLVGGVGEGAATTYTFSDLIPGAENVIGMRTIIGDNQSNLAWITIETPAETPANN